VSSKLFAVATTVAALFGLASVAQAGAPARTNNGKSFLVLQFKISPPRAGQGVGIEFDSFAGNDVDGTFPTGTAATRVNDVRLAKGFKVNPSAFVSCTRAQIDKNKCPAASKLATGTATADARPTIATPVQAKLTAFNGKTTAGKPALLLRALANLNGSQVPLVLVAEIKPPASGLGPGFVVDAGPLASGSGSLFGISQLHLNFPDKAVRVRGRAVHYTVAPTTCRGSWLFEQINTSYAGAREVATDRMPCVK